MPGYVLSLSSLQHTHCTLYTTTFSSHGQCSHTHTHTHSTHAHTHTHTHTHHPTQYMYVNSVFLCGCDTATIQHHGWRSCHMGSIYNVHTCMILVSVATVFVGSVHTCMSVVGITGYGSSTLFIGIAMVFVFSCKIKSYFHFKLFTILQHNTC